MEVPSEETIVKEAPESRYDSGKGDHRVSSDDTREEVRSPRTFNGLNGMVRQLSQWSSHFRGEESENITRPPSGAHFQRTSSTLTTEKPYGRQTSIRSIAAASPYLARSVSRQSVRISRADYHNDLKQDLSKNLNANLIFAAIVVVFGSSFLFGYNIGVLNQQVDLIKDFYKTVLTARKGSESATSELTVLWSLTTALFIPGGFVGSMLGGWMADRFGRKLTLLISQVFVVIGASLAGACVKAQSPEMLMISRVLFGINAGLGNCAAPMFLSEISPLAIRGAFTAIHQLFITIGILVSSLLGLPQILGTDELWPFLLLFELLPAVAAIIAIPFLRETPRYLLLIKGQEKQAEEALIFYRKTENIFAEMEEMHTEDKQKSSSSTDSFTWKQLMTTTALRRPLLIATMLQVMQQFSGINAVFFYSAGIFASAGVPKEHIPYAILGTNFVNVMMTVITVPIIDRVGRRPLLMIPMLIMAGDLILLTVCLNLQVLYSWLGIISVILVIIYVVGFAVGLGPIPSMLSAELFRQGPRPKAMALTGVVNWICTFIIAMSFEPLKDVTGEFTFIIFCILLVIFTAFTFICIPETKNLTFEEISNKFSPGEHIEVAVVEESNETDVFKDQVVEFNLHGPSMIEKSESDSREAIDVSEYSDHDTRL